MTEKRLFKAVKKQVSKPNAKAFLDSLVSDGDTYRLVHEPTSHAWRLEELAVRDSLAALDIFNVRQQAPLVLAIVRNYQQKRLSLKQARDALWTLEAFYFLFTAVTDQRPSGGFGMMMARFARELEGAANTQEKATVVANLQKKLREAKPTQRLFEYYFSQLRFSDTFTRQKKIVQYTLRHFARHGLPHSVYNFEHATIEHIAPQSASASLSVDLIAMMGNLALVNQSANHDLLGNKPFPKKKVQLLAAMGYTDDVIVIANEWTKSQIEKRTLALSKLAYESIWVW